MTTRLSLLLAAIALGAGCGGGGDNGDEAAPAAPATTSPASEPITVTLHEVNDSGQSGTATLVPSKVGTIETFKVRLEIEPLLNSPQMAHVHRVTCAEYAKIKGIDKQILTVHSPLADVQNGESESTVPGSVATGEFSINVHEPASPFPAVACGDIPSRPE
jgi:hypothetical protein